jgi:hypothetical protein
MTANIEIEDRLRHMFDVIGTVVPDEPPTAWSEFIMDLRVASSTSLADSDGQGGRSSSSNDVSIGFPVPETEKPLRDIQRSQSNPRSKVSLTHVSVLGVACAAAALTLFAVWAPNGTPGGSNSAAAAVLRLTAVKAGDQTVLQPGIGQALNSHFKVAIEATEANPDGTQRSEAQFVGTADEWTFSNGSGHEQVSFGPPHFGSPSNQQAWQLNEQIPFQGSVPYSSAGPVIHLVPALGSFNVSSLPTKPDALAALLGQKVTGIEGLDILPMGPDIVFDRIGLLLATPQLGNSPALASALYQVLASLPGITSLGRMSDHVGRSGTGFTEVGSGETLIVNTNTGSLFELHRNPTSSIGSAISGTAAFNGPVNSQETLLWLDPQGQTIVSGSSVPNTSQHS